MESIKKVERMLAVSTPIVAVDSYDHPHTINQLRKSLSEAKRKRPVIGWNVVDCFIPYNSEGESVLANLDEKDRKMAAQGGPHVALHVAQKFAEGTVLVMDNLHWFWDKPNVMQALLNARDPFKANKRSVVALVLNATLPADLVQNVSYVEDPLPSEDALGKRVRRIYASAHGEDAELSDEDTSSFARELRGTSTFRAEQLVAQSLRKDGLDRDKLRDNARKQINDTPGLSVETGDETFDDIGGLDAIKKHLDLLHAGNNSFDVLVRIEELEKAMAGSSTDSSGTTGDALGVLLTALEDFKWGGMLLVGTPGAGKSLIAKAAANQFGAKAIRFDMNATKNSLVGESGRQIRAAVDVLHAIGGKRVFFLASVNQIASLPPELRRRFNSATYFFDTPDAQQRAEIWGINCEQFGIDYDGYDADQLTGADIRDICRTAWELNITVTEASGYTVPLHKSAPNIISQMRQDASGRYLDANNGGVYSATVVTMSRDTSRSFDLED